MNDKTKTPTESQKSWLLAEHKSANSSAKNENKITSQGLEARAFYVLGNGYYAQPVFAKHYCDVNYFKGENCKMVVKRETVLKNV